MHHSQNSTTNSHIHLTNYPSQQGTKTYNLNTDAMQEQFPFSSQNQSQNSINNGLNMNNEINHNNTANNNNNCKQVNKIMNVSSNHGKHGSLYEKNNTNITQVQQNAILRLPSIGSISATKHFSINPLSPNQSDSLFDTENRFINSCSSAQQKKRMIRVQSKNKFPSDFFNENKEQISTLNNINEDTFNKNNNNNDKFFQSPSNHSINQNNNNNNINFSSNNNNNTPYNQQRNSNPNINPMKFSQQLNQNNQKQVDQYPQDYFISNNVLINSTSAQIQQQQQYQQQLQLQQQQYENQKNVQRPFISAMASRSTKSPCLMQQALITPQNKQKIDFQYTKNNFIEQDIPQLGQTHSRNELLQNNNNNQHQKNIQQKALLSNRNNLSSSGSVKRLISAQIPTSALSPCNTFRLLSPPQPLENKQLRLLSPQSSLNSQAILNRINSNQKQIIQTPLSSQSSTQIQFNYNKNEIHSVQEIDAQEIPSSQNDLSIPNSPKHIVKNSISSNINISENNNNNNTPNQQQINQKNIQQHPISQQQQRSKQNSTNNLKSRTPHYDVKSSSNIHDAINKGSLTCKSNLNDKKEKCFPSSSKESNNLDNENNQETSSQAANKFISRKPVVTNKQKQNNIDFTNFKMPMSTMNRKIKEIQSLPNQQVTSHKLTTANISSQNQKSNITQNTSNNNNNDPKRKKSRTFSAVKIQSTATTPTQQPNTQEQQQQQQQQNQIQSTPTTSGQNNNTEIQDKEIIQEEIMKNQSIKEEQNYEGDNSDTTKNSIQQNNTISLNSPSIQYDNPYLFSDKHIQSTQNSMIQLPPPQLKQFYSDCGETSSFNQIQSSHNNNNGNHINQDENIFNLDSHQKINYPSSMTYFQNNNSNSQNSISLNNINNNLNEFIQREQNINMMNDFNHTNNNNNHNNNSNYNKTANFTDCKDTFDNISIQENINNNNNQNNIQKLKSSQKALPKIALNFKESEKYKPFLIRKVSSQSSMRVKQIPCSLNNYSSNSTSSSQSNNINFDFNKNGSASTTHGKSLISTPTLLASNEYINSHEFSFSNQ